MKRCRRRRKWRWGGWKKKGVGGVKGKEERGGNGEANAAPLD